jgi:hypothetical protein
MAQKVSVVLIDDMDGGEAEGTVEFGLDGTIYEIGLSHGLPGTSGSPKALRRQGTQGRGHRPQAVQVSGDRLRRGKE